MHVVDRYPVSATAFLRGMFLPMSRSAALDPFAIKLLSKASPRRIVWTAQSRMLQLLARLTFTNNISAIRNLDVPHRFPDRGQSIPDTAVTSRQRDLLLAALGASSTLKGDVAEIGSYRGATTGTLALATTKNVFAIDPFIGYGGAEDELQVFLRASREIKNIKHVRKTSGDAAANFGIDSLAFVFIDGVHDFSNSWFDFSIWSQKIVRGGFLALHDVDDHPGAAMTCRRVSHGRDFRPWGYCPNLMIFEKL